jgi:hypothetical protein
MFKIYCLKDKHSKIVYVGYTTQSLHNRWRHHKNTYPDRKDLKIELILEVELKEQAKSLEMLYQKQYNTLKPNGLNEALGHINHDGSRLIKAGFKTRFGQKKKTPQEEIKRKESAREALKKLRKPVICLNTRIVYESVGICAKLLGLSKGNLCLVLKGKRPHTKGLRFQYYCPIKIFSN